MISVYRHSTLRRSDKSVIAQASGDKEVGASSTRYEIETDHERLTHFSVFRFLFFNRTHKVLETRAPDVLLSFLGDAAFPCSDNKDTLRSVCLFGHVDRVALGIWYSKSNNEYVFILMKRYTYRSLFPFLLLIILFFWKLAYPIFQQIRQNINCNRCVLEKSQAALFSRAVPSTWTSSECIYTVVKFLQTCWKKRHKTATIATTILYESKSIVWYEKLSRTEASIVHRNYPHRPSRYPYRLRL